MFEVGVPSTSTVSKPRTAAAATADFAGFLNCAASEAYGARGLYSGFWCLRVDNGRRHIETTRRKSSIFFSSMGKRVSNMFNLLLTFAGLDALKPAVTGVSIARTSAISIPGPTRGATTDSPRFLELATVWAHCYRRGDVLRC